MKARKKPVLTVAILVAAGLIYYFAYYRNNLPGSQILASGHIETTEVDMSFRLSGHVVRILVEEGDQVKKGAVIARLDPSIPTSRRDQAGSKVKELTAREASLELAIQIKEDLSREKVKGAKADVSAASARYESLRTGSREEEIAEAAASRDLAKAEWENREADFQRMKTLYDTKIIAASQYDASRTAAESAKSAYLAALERYKLVKAGPRRERIMEGEANLTGSGAALKAAEVERRDVERMKLDLKALQAQREEAKALLAIAEEDLANTQIYAPFDGFVTIKDVEEGEFVQAGTPVVTLSKLDRVWVKTYIPETQLGRIVLGQEAQVISDTFPDKTYPGTVTYISPEAEFTPKNVQTQEERVKLVYRIKVTLENPRQELKIGMPVDVLFR